MKTFKILVAGIIFSIASVVTPTAFAGDADYNKVVRTQVVGEKVYCFNKYEIMIKC